MNKLMKALIVVAGLVVALVVGGATAYAYTGWEAGKQHLDKTSENIDKLSQRIQELKTEQNGKVSEIARLNDTVKGLQQELLNTKNQWASDRDAKDKEIQAKINEVNQKIAEGQQAVAEKQKEVDKLNKKLEDSDKATSDLERAIKDAKDLRDKSDRAVEMAK